MTTQPEALRLAAELDAEIQRTVQVDMMHHNAAAELRRLSIENEALGLHLSERMKDLAAVEAQRDALLEKIKAVIAAEQSEGSGRGGFVNTPPTREHQRRVAQAWQQLHAAIKAVEEGE